MNRGQLTLRVSRMLGIPVGTSDDELDESALLDELANEAVLDILARTRIHVRRAQSTLAVGWTDFDLDDTVLTIHGGIRAIGADGGSRLLVEQKRDDLIAGGYAFAGLTRIVFGAPSEGETIDFWYTPMPSPMTQDSDDPALRQFGRIPSDHHRAIINYMCWHAADKAGDQGSARGDKYRTTYEGRDGAGNIGSDLGRIKMQINFLGSKVRVSRQREMLVGDTNPSYWTG
jgi:hypothetical protein